jgi:hypothetical protein
MKDSGIPYERILNRYRSDAPGEVKSTGVFKKFLSHIRIKATDEYCNPPAVVSVRDVVIATEGNFSASVGKPKSRKTYNVCAITAAMLSDKEVLCYKAHLPENKPRVLYVDTEQSHVHCLRVLKRIIKMAGISDDEADERVLFVMLREFSPQERRDIIDKILETDATIGFVVIDGIRDLLNDINSPTESVEIINDLLRWTQVYNIHIHTVLHTNKNDDNTRGHVGSELNNKAETVMRVTKSLQNPTISEVRPMITRDQEFESFVFRINKEGVPELASGVSTVVEDKVKLADISAIEHKKVLDRVFKESATFVYGALVNSLQQEYARVGYRRGRTTIVELLKMMQRVNVINCEDKKYSYCPENIEHLNK